MNIDKQIIDKLIAGDHKAFHTVFIATYPKVRSFVYGFVKNEADIDDLVQTVFIKLWTKRESLASVENLDSYLYVVTKNTVLNFLASQKVFSIDISTISDIMSHSSSPQEHIEAEDLKLLIDLVVNNMPPQRKTIYLLSREEGLTNDQIAERLGLQKKTVENHINLALNEIRKAIGLLILLLLNWG